MDRVVEATRDEDYDWLSSVVTPDAVEDLKSVRPLMVGDHTLVYYDDFDGHCQYGLAFEDGTTLHLCVASVWPKCPGRDITEEEAFTNLRLESISR